MAHFKSKKMQGVVYDLGHLDPMQFEIEVEGAAYKIHVIFGCHCFTKELNPQLHKQDSYYEHGGELRALCTERYALSKNLPAIIKGLGSRTIYHGSLGNYFLFTLDADTAYPGPYLVFFDVARAKKKDYDVVMNVQSAYLKPGMADWASPVKFSTLVKFTSRSAKPPLGPPMAIKRK